MTKRIILGLAVISILVVLGSSIYRGNGPPTLDRNAHSTKRPPRATPVSNGNQSHQDLAIASRIKSGRATQLLDYQASMRQSRDYWAFATGTLPAARAGDADAQYFLSRALTYCSDSRIYLVRRGEPLTKDEALQWARQRNLRQEAAATAFDRCHYFQERDASKFGTSAEWLAKATESGQPSAQSATALKMLLQESMRNNARAGGVLEPGGEIASALNPRELLLSAVQNADAQVLWNVGEAQGLLAPGAADVIQRQFAWQLLACRSGFDCSPTADWVIEACRSDPVCGPGNTGEDVIQYLAGDRWPAVQRLADDIHDKMQAGNWAALGLGS